MNKNDSHSNILEDSYTLSILGVALMAIGLTVCFLGAGSAAWIMDHGFLSAPVLVLLTFEALGTIFIIGALKLKVCHSGS